MPEIVSCLTETCEMSRGAMDPTSVIDDAEFWLPSEFLTDEDFLLEKENIVKPVGDEEDFLAGLTKQPTLKHDFSRGLCAFTARNDVKALITPQSTHGIGCACRNQRSRVSSPAEEMARMNINYDRGILHHPSAVKNGTGYYSHQSLEYQRLQALQFQQLRQRQLLLQSRASSKNGAPPAWLNQLPRRDGSGMRAVFLGKRGSTGTGVFLPRRVNHNTPPATAKSSVSTVLVPARVAQVLHLKLDEPASNYNGGFSSQSQMKAEQPVYETLLPPDWAY